MQPNQETKNVRGIIALILWLIGLSVNALVMFQWVESPWILQSSDHGAYYSIGAFVLTIIGLAILGSTEAGAPGATWNTVLGIACMLTGAGFGLVMLALTPSMGWAYTNEYRALWWLILAGLYLVAGMMSMPSKKVPRN